MYRGEIVQKTVFIGEFVEPRVVDTKGNKKNSVKGDVFSALFESMKKYEDNSDGKLKTGIYKFPSDKPKTEIEPKKDIFFETQHILNRDVQFTHNIKEFSNSVAEKSKLKYRGTSEKENHIKKFSYRNISVLSQDSSYLKISINRKQISKNYSVSLSFEHLSLQKDSYRTNSQFNLLKEPVLEKNFPQKPFTVNNKKIINHLSLKVETLHKSKTFLQNLDTEVPVLEFNTLKDKRFQDLQINHNYYRETVEGLNTQESSKNNLESLKKQNILIGNKDRRENHIEKTANRLKPETVTTGLNKDNLLKEKMSTLEKGKKFLSESHKKNLNEGNVKKKSNYNLNFEPKKLTIKEHSFKNTKIHLEENNFSSKDTSGQIQYKNRPIDNQSEYQNVQPKDNSKILITVDFTAVKKQNSFFKNLKYRTLKTGESPKIVEVQNNNFSQNNVLYDKAEVIPENKNTNQIKEIPKKRFSVSKKHSTASALNTEKKESKQIDLNQAREKTADETNLNTEEILYIERINRFKETDKKSTTLTKSDISSNNSDKSATTIELGSDLTHTENSDSYSNDNQNFYSSTRDNFEEFSRRENREFVFTFEKKDITVKTLLKNSYIKVMISSDFTIENQRGLIKDLETILQENGFKRFNVVIKEKTKRTYNSEKTSIERAVDVKV